MKTSKRTQEKAVKKGPTAAGVASLQQWRSLLAVGQDGIFGGLASAAQVGVEGQEEEQHDGEQADGDTDPRDNPL